MIEGVLTPIITVFDDKGNLDYEGNKIMIEGLIRAGVNGILFLGSIGEFFTMTMEEKKAFTRFAIQTVNKRVPVLIGTGGTCVDEVIELSRFAEAEGADGAVVISPYYFKLDEENIYRYYKAVAESVKMSIILYNFPDRTAVNMEPEFILKLAKDFPNIVGIKDTVDNISHTRKLISTVKAEVNSFSVLSGFDEYFIPNLMAGGNGLIGGLTNIAPQLFVRLYKAVKEHDADAVFSIQKNIAALMGLYDISQPFIPAIKMAASLVGNNVSTVCRQPAGPLDAGQINAIKNILHSVDLID